MNKVGSLAVYVHFPWCVRKCPYCDFASFEHDSIPHADYAEALLSELEMRADAFEGRVLTSVFFGGGTPSLWQPAQLGRVLERVRGLARSATDVEVTVECNPSSIDADRARTLVDVGVDRLSIGVQSLDDARLRFLGRLHDAAAAMNAVRGAIEAGVPRVSADLIFGVTDGELAAQTPADAAAEARRVARLGVGHVSAYALTIEPNTRFGELARAGRLPQVSDGLMAETFLAVGESLAEEGMLRYEISNFARPGEHSRHNLAYWRGHDYLGIGCAAYGALSHEDGSALRYRNAPNPDRYLERAATGDWTPHERDELSPDTRMRERIMLGLRLRGGVDIEAAGAELGVDPWPAARRTAARRLVERGQLQVDGGRLQIPRAAWLFADGVAAELF